MADSPGVGPDIFGEDYLHFYAPLLTDERTEREVELIARLLALPAGARVLDMPCGHGRIANRLAARGLQVTGVDNDEVFLARARADAAAAGVEVDYRAGDMRQPPIDGGFDAAVNWFSSFGYFDDAGNVRCLGALADALRPGGQLLIEMHDRDALVARLATAGGESTHMVQVGDDLVVDRATFDPVAGRSRTERVTVRDGRVRHTDFSVRMPTFPELHGWLQAAGFTDARALDERGAPFAVGARRLVVLATR